MYTNIAGRSGWSWEETQGVVSSMKLDSTPPTPASIVLPPASEEQNLRRGRIIGRELGDELLWDNAYTIILRTRVMYINMDL